MTLAPLCAGGSFVLSNRGYNPPVYSSSPKAHAYGEERRAPRPAQNDATDLREFFAILNRHRKMIAACVVGCLALAGVYLAFAGVSYTATVAILIDARNRTPVGADAGANAANTPDATLVESQVKLISSDTVLRRVAESENLANDPDYVPTRPGLRARLYPYLGLKAPQAGDDKLGRATNAFARSVAVKRSERTYVIEVDVSSGSPEKAARLANNVADAYIADQKDARAQIAQNNAKYLAQRIAELQTKVQEAEIRAQEYRVKNRISDAVGKNAVEQEFGDLTTELGKARSRTIEARAHSEQLRRLAASGRSTAATGDAVKSPVLEKLRAQYADIARQEAHYKTTLGARHPAMLEVQSQLRDTQQMIGAELKRIAETAANEYQLARDAERETAKRVETARLSTDTKNGSLVELRELDREVDARRTAYEKFLRARETIYDDSSDGPIARVIAPASAPLAPSSPKTMAILFISLVTGLSLGVGGALLREYIAAPAARRNSNEDARYSAGFMDDGEAYDEAPLEVIASVPRMGAATTFRQAFRKWTRSKSEAAVVDHSMLTAFRDNPGSAFSLAIGALHDRLTRSARKRGNGRGSMKVLLSSVHEGRGKTTIAANLAMAAAQAGKRVLLIDANPQNPSLRALITDDMQPGLIELSGSLRPVYTVAGANGEFCIVPMMTNESELCRALSRRAATPRIHGIEGRFEFVIIDGPTLDSGRDIRLVAGAVNRILVIASEEDSTPSIDALADALGVPEQRLAGTVVSMAPPLRAA